jgi:hypothetical protein
MYIYNQINILRWWCASDWYLLTFIFNNFSVEISAGTIIRNNFGDGINWRHHTWQAAWFSDTVMAEAADTHASTPVGATSSFWTLDTVHGRTLGCSFKSSIVNPHICVHIAASHKVTCDTSYCTALIKNACTVTGHLYLTALKLRLYGEITNIFVV